MNWYNVVALIPGGLLVNLSRVWNNPTWQLFWLCFGVGYCVLQTVCLGLVIRDGVKLRKRVRNEFYSA